MKKLSEPGVAARVKSTRSVPIARRMRKEMTRSERILWNALKRFPLPATHWRKQAAIGPFIVDFVCHAARIIVEVDGRVHCVEAVTECDQQRQAWLEGRGYRVLRFTNVAVEQDVGAIVRSILAAASEPA